MIQLEFRLKLNFFVLLQRIHIDERVERISQEVKDNHELIKKLKQQIQMYRSEEELFDRARRMIYKESA